jgi:hypothetical protein
VLVQEIIALRKGLLEEAEAAADTEAVVERLNQRYGYG